MQREHLRWVSCVFKACVEQIFFVWFCKRCFCSNYDYELLEEWRSNLSTSFHPHNAALCTEPSKEVFDMSELPAKYFLLLPLLWNLLLNIFALLTFLWNPWILLKTINHVRTNSISDRSHQSWSVPNIVSAVWSWTPTSLIVQLFTPPHHHLPSLTKIMFFSLSYVDNQQLWLGNWGWSLLITIPISNSVSSQKMQ